MGDHLALIIPSLLCHRSAKLYRMQTPSLRMILLSTRHLESPYPQYLPLNHIQLRGYHTMLHHLRRRVGGRRERLNMRTCKANSIR